MICRANCFPWSDRYCDSQIHPAIHCGKPNKHMPNVPQVHILLCCVPRWWGTSRCTGHDFARGSVVQLNTSPIFTDASRAFVRGDSDPSTPRSPNFSSTFRRKLSASMHKTRIASIRLMLFVMISPTCKSCSSKSSGCNYIHNPPCQPRLATSPWTLSPATSCCHS